MSIIHIAFTLFQRNSVSYYPMALAAAYRSMRQRTCSRLMIHVIADKSVTLEVRQKIKDSVDDSDMICFYNAEILPEVYEVSLKLDGRFSPAIVWRVWIERYLEHLEKCILVDCDFLFSANVSELWEMDLGECIMSAPLRVVPHSKALHRWLKVPAERYFRMCCSLINLSRLRTSQLFIANRHEFLIEAATLQDSGLKQAGLLEQSVFNKFFSNDCMPLIFPVIPVDRIMGHPREAEWLKVIQNNGPFLIDIKGWASNSPHSLLFWSSLLSTSWKQVAVTQFECWQATAIS